MTRVDANAPVVRPVSAVPARAGFTLIELILVMAMLSMVLALAAPSLARFFRGRGLDAEVNRFIALTRHGQSRAVSEGIPMVLWIDERQQRYGLEADLGFVESDQRAAEFGVNSNLVVEVEQTALALQANPWKGTRQFATHYRLIRFTPDGFIALTSPERILIRQGREEENDAVTIGQSRNRLHYEIQTNPLPLLRR